ncbi:MAG: OmpA family protein, partial [Sphingorhabdus sp.]|nr:OmpA family protein [Sphingorhabdus sp.]
MRVVNKRAGQLAVLAMLSIPVSGNLYAQQPSYDPIVVEGALPDLSTMAKGPEVKGTIIARNGEKLRVRTADGSSTDIAITDATKVKTSSGLFGGRSKMGNEALLNGLPVTVKTLQWDGGLVASQVSFRKGDFKTANMIRNGTEQQFAEQTAATEALRGRMGDIDKYNVKGVTNVYFDTGKAALSSNAKQDLCAAASQA